MPAPVLPIRAFQWDLARQVERLDWLLQQLPRYADWGYQELYLHLEDAVEFPSLPAVARKDAYTYRQMERLVTRATKAGINVVPIVNLLGHTQYLIKVPELRDLNELRNADGSPQATGQICPLHPRTLEVAEQLLRDMAPFCTAGKVHVGLDESFHLGKHPLSRREVRRIGLATHFAGHVNRLREITRRMNLRMGMWADMLYFLPGAIPLLPNDLIAYDWYYYPFKRLPRVELFNYAEVDLATPLMKRGIEYWGCPMNGAFRHEPMPHFNDRLANAVSWWKRCRKIGAAGFLMTSWEPNRLAMETTTLVDAAVSELWSPRKRRLNRTAMLSAGIRKISNQRNSALVAAELLAADRHAFTGYARWEINKAWLLASGPRNLATYSRELGFFDKLALKSAHWPVTLAASIAYRRYLAVRDVHVRIWRDATLSLREHWTRNRPIIQQLRRLLAQTKVFQKEWFQGRHAAEQMWLTSRQPNSTAPNLVLLDRDQLQLEMWSAWLRQCLINSEHVMTANTVVAGWLLSFSVWNFAPAVQRIVIEQRIGHAWQPVKSCHTIEFQSRGAAPQSSLRHLYAAPVSGSTEHPPSLRLVIGGVGRVRISELKITDGINTWTAASKSWLEVGHKPVTGWPRLDRISCYVPKLLRI
ncbi:MAG: family 20 glycosylhydrolase [Opitutaceae bacterium]|nr:family 20 glycosylhydrolase [Opitutaceae bacterium]